jgi:Glycosyl hydrolase family 79, N-terminal domain
MRSRTAPLRPTLPAATLCVALAAAVALGMGACSTSSPNETGAAGSSGSSGSAGTDGRGGATGSGIAGSSGGSSVTGGVAGSGTAGSSGGSSVTGTGGVAGTTAGGGESGRGAAGTSGAAGSGGGSGGAAGGNPPPPLTGTTTAATVKVTRGNPIGTLPAGTAGFSFEKSHMSDGFFTGTHAPLIAMFKLLGPGVVRIGADDVNNSVWVPSATFVKAGTTSPNVGTAEVDALADFLTATGWKAIYAVNMRGTSTPQTAVAELTYVVPKLGASLQAVEIGNELNLYSGINAESVWKGIAQAIRSSFPGTLIAGPGDFEDVNYCTKFVSSEASLIDIVTHHYYRGQAGTSVATLDNLINPDSTVTSSAQSLANSVKTNNIKGGFRFGECNSYSSHGTAGISDALVSALWGIDFMLTLARYGNVGVNFHGGGQNMDGNNCPNGVSSCDKPFRYSPLIEVDSKVTAAAPLFYGMLLVSQIGAGDMLATSISNAGTTKLRAYAVTPADGSTKVVLVNFEATTGVNATVDVGSAVASASAVYLRGASLTSTSTTSITLADAPVTPAGVWTPKAPYTLTRTGTTITVPVPAASAVLITVK